MRCLGAKRQKLRRLSFRILGERGARLFSIGETPAAQPTLQLNERNKLNKLTKGQSQLDANRQSGHAVQAFWQPSLIHLENVNVT